jgi:hypothetical protein
MCDFITPINQALYGGEMNILQSIMTGFLGGAATQAMSMPPKPDPTFPASARTAVAANRTIPGSVPQGREGCGFEHPIDIHVETPTQLPDSQTYFRDDNGNIIN